MRSSARLAWWLLLPALILGPGCGDDDDDPGGGDGDADGDGDGDADGDADGDPGTPFCGNGSRDGADECEGLDGCAEGEACSETCTCQALPPVPTTSQSLIAEALARGDIDYATSLVYRAWALFADSRLPPEYDGETWHWEDNGLFREAGMVWDSLDAATQADLQPFLLRPTEPGSYFSPLENAGGPGQGTDPTCPYQPGADQRDWRSTSRAGSPFVIWSCGMGNPDADPTAAKRDVALTIAEQVYGDMTPDTGLPAPDDNAEGPAPTNRIDVYLVNANQCKNRNDGNGCVALPVEEGMATLAAAVGTTPCGPGRTGALASSSFFMVDIGQVPAAAAGSPKPYRYVFAHEFFHLMQNALNLQAQGGGCGGAHPVDDTVTSWLVEASAEWASKAYYPDDMPGRRTGLFTQFQQRDQTLVSLRAYGGPLWDYQAFLYPLFVEQELAGRQRFITMWKESGGARSPRQLDDLLNDLLPFEEHFRDFAVRNLNTAAPGNAISPRYNPFDGQIPAELPAMILQPTVQLSFPTEWTRAAKMQSLTAQYEHFVVDEHIKHVRFDFQTIGDSGFLKADVLVKVGGSWQRRRVPGLVFEFCRDQAADDISELYLVLSHHNRRGGAPAVGDYRIETRFDCPGGWQGSVHFVSNHTFDYTTAGPAGTETYSMTEQEVQSWAVVQSEEAMQGPQTYDEVTLNWSGSYDRVSVLRFAADACLGSTVYATDELSGAASGTDVVAMMPIGNGTYLFQARELPTGQIESSGGHHGETCDGGVGDEELTDTRTDYLAAMLAMTQDLALLTPTPNDPGHFTGSANILHNEVPADGGGADILDQNVTWDLSRR